MLCCVQSGQTALYWAAYRGDVNIVQMLVDHGAAVDLGRDEVTSHDYHLWVYIVWVHVISLFHASAV
jgi:hypothetical protein